MSTPRVTPVKFSKEFSDLVRAVGECKSKTEEDRIVMREIDVLKTRLTDPNLDRTRIKEYIVRLIYIETLGHDASFGYIHAVKLCSDPSLVHKKVGYLASALFLHEDHELILLLINTITRDLRSDNFMIVCAALEATCKLINAETAPAVLPHVMELLKHPRELVRKKSASALHRFLLKNPSMREELDRPLRTLLCDKDPSVMAATLPALEEAIRQDPAPLRSLTGSFVAILKQILDHRLPKSYDYHKQPAPFVQIRLLKILALLGKGDRAASEASYAVLGECLRKGQASGNTIGHAIVCEVVRTIAAIHPHPGLLGAAADALAPFLRPGALHNLKYTGIGLLGDLIGASPEAASQHQMAVIDCLEDPDESLQARTLDLLGRMCNPSNAVVIADRMMQYLLATGDDEIRSDLGLRIYGLAEKFAPSAAWFLALGLRLLAAVPSGPGSSLPRLQRAFVSAVMEGADPELRAGGLRLFLAPLAEPSAPVGLLHVCIWLVGELVAERTQVPGPPLDLVECTRLLALAGERVMAAGASDVAGLAVTAIAKVALQLPPGARPAPEAAALLKTCACSRDTDLSQRACEAESLLLAREGNGAAARLLGSVFRPPTPDLMPEEGAGDAAQVDESLAFLDGFVHEALARGARPYRHPDDRAAPAPMALDDPHRHLPHAKAGLRFEAYQPAAPVATQVPAPGAVSQNGAGPSGAATALMDFFGGPSSSSTSAQPAPAAAAAAPLDSLFTPQQQAYMQQQQQQQQQAAASGVAATAAPPAASNEPKLQVQHRKWGPARFEEPPPPPQPKPAALPQLLQADLGHPTVGAALMQQAPGQPLPIGFVGFVPQATALPPQAHPAPPHVPQAPAVDPEKSRLASALFGGGASLGGSAGLGIRKASPTPANRSTPPATSAPAPSSIQTPAAGLLDLDLVTPPPVSVPVQPPPSVAPPQAPKAASTSLEALADILMTGPMPPPVVAHSVQTIAQPQAPVDPFAGIFGGPASSVSPAGPSVSIPSSAVMDPFAASTSVAGISPTAAIAADSSLFPVQQPVYGKGGAPMKSPTASTTAHHHVSAQQQTPHQANPLKDPFEGLFQ